MQKEQGGISQRRDSLTGRGVDANTWLEEWSDAEDTLLDGVDWAILRDSIGESAKEEVIDPDLNDISNDLAAPERDLVVRRKPLNRVSPRNGR